MSHSEQQPATPDEVQAAEIADLRARLAYAEETLLAIRSGEVDALVVETLGGSRIFTLQGVDAESNRFRGEILAQVSDAVIAVDHENHITYLNPAAERLYGVSASEALGRTCSDIFESRWLRCEDEAAAAKALHERQEWRGENIHVLRDGRQLAVESNFTVFRDGERTGLLAVIRDITERKQAEAALRASESRLALGVYVAGLGLAEINYLADTVELSREASHLFGFGNEPLTIPRKSLHATFHADDYEMVMQSIRDALGPQGTGWFGIDHRIIWPSGEMRWLRVRKQVFFEGSGEARRPTRAVLAALDVTPEKKAAAAVQQSAEFVRGVLDSLPDHVVVLNQEGLVLAVNAPWERFAVSNGGDLRTLSVGSNYLNVCRQSSLAGDETAHEALLGIESVLNGQCEMFEMEYCCPSKDRTLCFLMRVQRLANEQSGVILTHVDITDRKQMEEQLRQTTDRFQLALEGSSVVLFCQDLELRYTWIHNPALGMDVESVLGKKDWELFERAEDAERIEAIKRQVIETGTSKRQEVRIQWQGSPVYYDLLVEPLRTSNGKIVGVRCACVDITELKRTQSQLERNRDTFFALIQNNPFGMYVIDSDFRLRQVSLGARKVFASLSPVLGRDFSEVLRTVWEEPFATEAINRFKHTLSTGEPYNAPSTVERRQDIGEMEAYDWRIERFTLPDGSFGVVCYFYDLSERQRWSAAIRESEERLRLATEAAELGIWTWQPQEDQLSWENERSYEILGISPGQGITKLSQFATDILHADDLSEFQRAVGSTLNNESPLAFLGRIRRKDGSQRWVELTGMPAPATEMAQPVEPSQPARIIGTVQDVTQRQQIAAALREADRRKDEFLATLAHELRNPLAPLRNAVQVLQLTGPGFPEMDWAKEVIDRQVHQMTRLIDDLMDVSRVNQGKVELRQERIELVRVIQGAIETSRPLIDQMQHELVVDLPSESVIVYADMTRLAQVFMNLLNNAAKYTEPGGHIRLNAHRDGNEVIVSVRDTGIGIPADKLPHIFEMFSQVENALSRSQGGLGIGLSLVKQLTEMHGGSVEVQSFGMRKGTEFTVRLPVAKEKGIAFQPTPVPDNAEVGAKLRILVVDDNRDAATSLAMFLKITGNNVSTVFDGESAVRMGASFLPDVVLCDIGLPHMNGYDTAAAIRQQPWGKSILLIAITGWGQVDDIRKSKEAGFDRHLVKPVDPTISLEIAGRVATALIAKLRPHLIDELKARSFARRRTVCIWRRRCQRFDQIFELRPSRLHHLAQHGECLFVRSHRLHCL